MTVLDLVLYSFLFVVLLQFVYFGLIFLRFGLHKYYEPTVKNIGVSVIVSAKNESHNLKAFIPQILKQNYSQFELILINDGSTDDSLEIMRTFEKEDNKVKVVDVKPVDSFWNNKKYPLTLGIKAASFDFLLLTDADCRPVSENWIREMSRQFSNTKTIVLGFGSYMSKTKSFMNMLIRYETFLTAIQYFSYALLGMPYMGVGRNLAYRKDVFFKAGGFKDHMSIPSGDDDLFINQVANTANTAICYHRDSQTESVPETSLGSWIRQKRRHVRTARYYKTPHKLSLGLFYLSQLLFLLLGAILLISGFNFKLTIALVILRYILVYVVFGLAMRKLRSIDLLMIWPVLELFLVLMQLVIFISNLTAKQNSWK
ncbi:MAG: glycosyltransferase [Bacteroidia bacterium]|nr:glycosyltransferase [Bacteroidia bacterium]